MDETVGSKSGSPTPTLQCGSDSSRVSDLDQLTEWPDALTVWDHGGWTLMDLLDVIMQSA